MVLSILFFIAFLFNFSVITRAEPVQYCRFGHHDGEVDFCVGITNGHNHSVDAYDLYVSLSVTRSSALGWTAIGTGPLMAGSLMFIVYGDPFSGEDPVLSIRTVDGHHQPRLITRQDMGGADIRILQATWIPPKNDHSNSEMSHESTFLAKFALVCYSCSRWPGTPISPLSSSQPWIWAWNDKQNIPVYSFDAHLDMHKHRAGNGGWGRFYVDMARSISEAEMRPSLPPLRAKVSALGTSDTPTSVSGVMASFGANPLLPLHGLLMGTSFLLLIPLGVMAMRSGSTESFKYHWLLQALASLFVTAGAITGIAMGRGKAFTSTHQWIGVAITLLVGVQMILGWRHHVVFLRVRCRTWISHAHIWLGRLSMVGGWSNVLSGMVLSGHSWLGTGLTTAFVVAEALGISLWVWTARSHKVNTGYCCGGRASRNSER